MSQVNTWTPDDFLALTLVYAAHVDKGFSEEEKIHIRKQVGEEPYERANYYYQNKSEYGALRTIVELKKRFYPGATGTEEIVDKLKGLFESDGEFSHLEQIVGKNLKRLFEAEGK